MLTTENSGSNSNQGPSLRSFRTEVRCRVPVHDQKIEFEFKWRSLKNFSAEFRAECVFATRKVEFEFELDFSQVDPLRRECDARMILGTDKTAC